MSDPINLFYIDGEALDGMVQAGDSADRTVRAAMKGMAHDRQKNLVYWLEQAHKEAKRILHAGEISAFAEGVKEEHRKHPLPTYEVNGKVYKHQVKKPAPKPKDDNPLGPINLLDLFGM